MASDRTNRWLGLGPSRFIWDDPKHGQFLVHLHWAAIEGEGRLVGVDLRSVDTYDRSAAPQPISTGRTYFDAAGNHYPQGEPVPASKPFARLSSDVWRRFSFRRVEKERAQLLHDSEMLERWEKETPLLPQESKEELARDAQGMRNKKPRGLAMTYEHYEALAKVVTEAHANGNRNTLKVLEQAFGINRNMANYRRKRAQSLGLLPPPVPRQPRTPKHGA